MSGRLAVPQPLRVYVDSSVFGGAFDEEFAEESNAFFDLVRNGRFAVVTSALVADEISTAPEQVAQLFEEMLRSAEFTDVDSEVRRLVRGYIEAQVVTEKWRDDATHVALATVGRCSLIVSWNFKHIVHYQKIPRYNAVNVLHGYPSIAIYSPLEIISDEED
jgi:predicted nucleic acid-binding protein